MLTPALAARAKLRIGSTPFGLRVMGVNGDADVGLADVKDFGLIGATLHNWQFLVGASRLEPRADGLLGQNLLTVYDTEFDLANGAIRLFKPSGCGGKALAYWADNQPYNVVDLDRERRRPTEMLARASVNGAEIKVIFDSGAYRSLLSTRAAGRAGVSQTTPGVMSAGPASGVGRGLADSWIGPFASFKIGDEEIRNTRLRFGAMDIEEADMLLGADFFLSHRILFSRSQDKVYFTYNGGPVFRLDRLPSPGAAQTQAQSQTQVQTGAPAAADQPKDADGFARRAGALAARGEVDRAIADLGQAIALDPNNPRLPFERAQLYMRQRKPALALADLQAALKRDPHYAPALMSLAERSLALKDDAGARANFEAAAAADPELAMNVAAIFANQGWFERSLELWDQWIATHARDDRLPDALNGRCWARALWGRDLDKALADCDRAVRMSRIASFLDSRGLVRLRLGQYDGAISDYTAALKDNPRQAWSLYGRGLAELKKGDKDKGEADIKAAIAINPRLPELAARYGIASGA